MSSRYASRVEAEQMAAVIEANGGDLRSARIPNNSSEMIVHVTVGE